MRGAYPDRDGYVTRQGVKLHYEVFGKGAKTILLLPTWSIVHSHHWKAQVPYLSRHFRVITFDGRGNGLSDRPERTEDYADDEFAADALAVLDETETDAAVVLGFSAGARWALLLAAERPNRVAGAVFIGAAVPLADPNPERAAAIAAFDEPRGRYEEWYKYNRHYWLSSYRGFLEFFFGKIFSEPHSTKQIEDCVGWGLQTTPEVLIATHDAAQILPQRARELAAAVRCPVLVIHGDQDAVVPYDRGRALAEATGGTLMTMSGSGHCPHARDPVKVNLALREFASPRNRSRAEKRGAPGKRALFISSPIGLGHAQRDIAIAQELRKLHPDLQIDWLAQHPVTLVLERYGERIHPASAALANESAHIESEAAEHDLHCFQTMRNMDEILLANFMVFHDVITDTRYDLWIGDEAWELDYYLHENPKEKRASYIWMTDFVGWLPMTDGGEREAFLTADYNADMIEHIANYPQLRDRSIFVGNSQDVVPNRFGANLPSIRRWTEEHYAFAGYVTGFDPRELAERSIVRASLGYRPGEKVCIVSVGGSGVGAPLLARVMKAYPYVKREIPEFRMIVVAGPRIELDSLPRVPSVELRSYVPELYRHLAVCDIAVVQGGLTTTMELTANKTPFIYFPLRHHFEQNFHVRHRLNQYGAGCCMDYAGSDPEAIAAAVVAEIGKKPNWRDVETDGALRAARLMSQVLS